MESYEILKQEAMKLLEGGGACEDGCRKVAEAQNLGRMLAVLRQYWGEMIIKFQPVTTAFFERFFAGNAEEFHRHHLYYNESAVEGRVLLTRPAAEVKDDPNAIYQVAGQAEVWAFGAVYLTAMGDAHVRLRDQAQCLAGDCTYIQAFDHTAVAAYDAASVHAQGRSEVLASGHVKVDLSEDAIGYARAWTMIRLFGRNTVYAPMQRKVNARATKEGRIEIMNETEIIHKFNAIWHRNLL